MYSSEQVHGLHNPAQTKVLEIGANVLTLNDRVTHTIPAEGHYPGPFLWDSALAAIGIRHFDPVRAATEINELFRGQWQNGMLPSQTFTVGHVLGRFVGKEPFRPDAFTWNSRLLHADSPRDTHTTGITQPPIIAHAALQVGELLDPETRDNFYTEIFANLVRYHQWIYSERDYNNNGLFSSVHPWETGIDNTPSWMVHMSGLRWPGQPNISLESRLGAFIATAGQVFRRDIKLTDASTRASQSDSLLSAQAFISLVRARYDHSKLRDHHPLHIEDVHLTSVLIRNNDALVQIGKEIAREVPEDLLCKMEESRASLELLWDEHNGMYYPRDAITMQLIKVPTISSLMPLYAGALPQERVARLIAHLEDEKSFNLIHGVPSVPANSEHHRADGYSSGPIFTHLEWLIYTAIKESHPLIASSIGGKTIRALLNEGPREYRSALDGRGLGARNFTWTAALAVDIALRDPKLTARFTARRRHPAGALHH